MWLATVNVPPKDAVVPLISVAISLFALVNTNDGALEEYAPTIALSPLLVALEKSK